MEIPRVKRLEVGPLLTNCYILYWSDGRAIIIDPGDEANRIINTLRELDLDVEAIILTHGHVDHIAALPELLNEFNVPFIAHSEEKWLLKLVPQMGKIFGIKVRPIPLDKMVTISNGDEVAGLKVMHTPGHSPGSISLYGYGMLFSGDTLFKDAVGRTDLPGGSEEKLCRSLKTLMRLPDETIVYPGHGEETTIGYERENNIILSIVMDIC